MKIYVDGQNTPHHSMICVVREDNEDNNLDSMEQDSNINHVEIAALLSGIQKALEEAGKNNNCIVISDSTNAIKWYYLSDDAKKIRRTVGSSGKKIFVCWLPREKNLAGIKLEERLKKYNKSIAGVLNPTISTKKYKAQKKQQRKSRKSPSVQEVNNSQGEKARSRKGDTILTDEVSTPKNSLAINGVVTPGKDSSNLNNTSEGAEHE